MNFKCALIVAANHTIFPSLFTFTQGFHIHSRTFSAKLITLSTSVAEDKGERAFESQKEYAFLIGLYILLSWEKILLAVVKYAFH